MNTLLDEDLIKMEVQQRQQSAELRAESDRLAREHGVGRSSVILDLAAVLIALSVVAVLVLLVI